MACFVISCKQLINVDTNEDLVEVKYNKYIEGFGYETFTDYFNTELRGNFYISSRSLRYEKFLDTMVNKTIETRRRMVLIQLENVLLENKNVHSLIRLMNSVKIVDPTFRPPYINKSCSWQKRMVRDFCLTTLPKVIETCTNDNKLETLFNVLKLIESELIVTARSNL